MVRAAEVHPPKGGVKRSQGEERRKSVTMILKATETINCPPEQVFDTLIDVEHLTDWASGPQEVTNVSEKPAQMGTTFQQRASLLGRGMEINATVNVLEPGRKFGSAFDKPFPGHITFKVEPQGGGTKLTMTGGLEPGGFFKLAGPLLSRSLKGTMEKDLRSLKATLEKA